MKRLLLLIALVTMVCGASAEKYIVIDKPSLTLTLKDGDKTLATYPVCCGMNYGQKKRRGDHKTPEGTFKISVIHNAIGWGHDFNDGKGMRNDAYGPWFFRLNTPQSKYIGIHGTCFPQSVKGRESTGCIRMRNEDISALRKHVYVGMKVIINPDTQADIASHKDKFPPQASQKPRHHSKSKVYRRHHRAMRR